MQQTWGTTPCGRDVPLPGQSRTQKWLDSWKSKWGTKGSHKIHQYGQMDPWRGRGARGIWQQPGAGKGAVAHGIGDGVGRSGRKQRSWGLATPCSRGRDAVGGLTASRMSGTGMRKLTMRSSLESDSELESSPLSRSR